MDNNEPGGETPKLGSEKLKKVTDQISKILEEADVAGLVIVYEPVFSQYIVNIGPTWSAAGINEKNQLQIHTPIEDPNNPNAVKAKAADTVNMLANIRMGCTRMMMLLGQAETTVRNHFGIKQPKAPVIQTNGFRKPPGNGKF